MSAGRLLQRGDEILTREGFRGVVVGVDLEDNHDILGPTFIIMTSAAIKVRRKSNAVTITKDAPASDPAFYFPLH